MSEYKYQGTELELFQLASNWKRYWIKQIGCHVGSKVLEVGAGIGANTKFFRERNVDHWVCLEPDPTFGKILAEERQLNVFPSNVDVRIGALEDLDSHELFDTVLYLDVLEHIQDDIQEIQNVTHRLSSGGKLIILAPAHNYLFSEFDKQVGHFRRYDKSTLKALLPNGFRVERIRYLDSIGLFASLANRLVIQTGLPSRTQILFWDRFIVRLSKLVDQLIGYRFGKSILMIAAKV